MRQVIEGMVAMIFIILLCMTGMDLVNVHMQAGRAKEFRNQVVTAIVNSDYDAQVIADCLNQAQNEEYKIKLEFYKHDGSHFTYKGESDYGNVEMMQVYVTYETKLPVLHTGWTQTVMATA